MDPKNLEQLREENRQDAMRQADNMMGFANETESRTINTLITIATVLITITGSFLPFSNKQMTDIEKVLLFVGWIVLFISIICGLIQSWINFSFYRIAFQKHSNRAAAFGDAFPQTEAEFLVMYDRSESIRVAGQNESTYVGLVLQVFSLVMGFILILVAAGFIIF